MIRIKFTRLGKALWDAPDWLHPIPSMILKILPHDWTVRSMIAEPRRTASPNTEGE